MRGEYFSESRNVSQDLTFKHFNKVTGEHFNLRGYSQSDMQISIVEKIYSNSDQFRKQRERLFISKFNTKYKGMNKKT